MDVAESGTTTNPEVAQVQPIAPPELPEQQLARRIGEALGYKSPAVATAINYDLEAAVNAGEVTEATVVEIVGGELYQEFKSLIEFAAKPKPAVKDVS